MFKVKIIQQNWQDLKHDNYFITQNKGYQYNPPTLAYFLVLAA